MIELRFDNQRSPNVNFTLYHYHIVNETSRVPSTILVAFPEQIVFFPLCQTRASILAGHCHFTKKDIFMINL